MSQFESQVLEMFQNFFKPQVVIPLILINRLQKLGIVLSADQQEIIKQQCKNDTLNSLQLTLSPEQEQKLEENGIDPNNIHIDLGDFRIDPEKITDAISEAIQKVLEPVSESLLKGWLEQSSDILNEEQLVHQEFEERLQGIWGSSLKLLEAFISVCHQSGQDFNTSYRPLAVQENDIVFDVLTRLHARGCQVAKESLILLKNGLADGAHARWRTLHEITVTAMFISKYGRDVAERYVNHSVITEYLNAQQYQQYCTLLGYEPLSPQFLDQLRVDKDEAVRRYGPAFEQDNGWAAGILRKTRFSDIERDVNLNHLRPFYKLANMNVHAGSTGITYRLGMPLTEDKLLLSGSSIYGLAEPGQNTTVSLQQLTVTLLLSRPNLDHIALSSTIQKLMNEVVWSFDETNSSMIESEEDLGD